MVSTDGRTDTEAYNIIPRHTLVTGYKNCKNNTNTLYYSTIPMIIQDMC